MRRVADAIRPDTVLRFVSIKVSNGPTLNRYTLDS